MTCGCLHTFRCSQELESSFWKYTIAGGIGGTLGGLISNPFDVIKTRQQLGLAPPNVFKVCLTHSAHTLAAAIDS